MRIGRDEVNIYTEPSPFDLEPSADSPGVTGVSRGEGVIFMDEFVEILNTPTM